MARDYICLYHSYLDAIQALGDAERGRLLTAMLEYSITGEAPQLSGNEKFLFPMVKAQIDRDIKKYEKACQKNALNGKSGGRPKNPKNPLGFSETQKSQSKGECKGKDKGESSPPVSPSPGERTQKKFVPPTLEEVSQYCRERNSSVDPKKFWEYFDTGKWVDSEGKPVKNWKQKLLTWEKFSPTQKEKPTAQSMNDETYKYIRAMYQHKEEP